MLKVESEHKIFEIQLFDYRGNRQMLIEKPGKKNTNAALLFCIFPRKNV